MKKKIFALLTALCMTAAVLPAVFADGEEGDLTIGSTQEHCSCVTLCTEDNTNPDCPVCSAEGVTACKGEPVVPVLYGAPKSTVNVTYLDEKGDKKEVSATQVTDGDTEWSTGWYVVQDTITISNRVTVKDNVHLILADGCNLTVNGGIDVTGTNSLTIYAQSAGSGTLTAQNVADNNAGIGGSNGGSGGTIKISGGKVDATGGWDGAGIGGGYNGSGGNIIISGGEVNATGGNNAAGIGGGEDGGGGSFSTGTDGNAVIFATGSRAGIDHKGNQGSWQGVIFEGNDGKVYGNPAPTQDFTIPSDKTLTIDESKTLTIPAGVTMTNEGTITNNGAIQNNGIIQNNNTIGGSGTLYNNGTLDGSGTVTCKVVEPTQPQPTDPTTPETTAPTDTDHTVQTDNSGHAPVEDNTALPSFWDLVTERINATPRGGEITINMGARAVPDSVLNALRARSLTATFRYGDTELTIAPDQLPPEGMLTEWTLHELGNYVTEADESIRISEEKSEAENATAAETAPAADTGKPNPATGETTTTAAMLVAVVALTGLGVTIRKK